MTLHFAKPGLLAAALSAALMISACSTTSKQSAGINPADTFGPLQYSSTEYQAIFQDADDHTHFASGILLARALIVNQDVNGARGVIDNLQGGKLSAEQQQELKLVTALLHRLEGHNQDAADTLAEIDGTQLNNAAARYYYNLRSKIESELYAKTKQKQHLVNAFDSQKHLIAALKGDDQKQIMQNCVNLLKSAPAADLAALAAGTADINDKGYFEYAAADSTANRPLKEKLLTSWLNKYGAHPLAVLAAAQIQTQMQAEPATSAESGTEEQAQAAAVYAQLKDGDTVAALLPLSGRFAASVGQPAKLGLLAAAKDRNADINIVFYDTNKETMPAIIEKLKANHTDYIIGPVLKPEVSALLSAQAQIPAVMLNYTADQELPANTFYFDLSPVYEGKLAAAKIAADGHVSPVIISAKRNASDRAAAGFNAAWQAYGQPAVNCRFSGIDQIQSDLASCPLNQADSIYISASPAELGKLRNLLPKSVPVFLTDESYSGYNDAAWEFYFKDFMLGDMPWLLTDSELKDSFLASLPKADAQAQRIFAAAYDSLNFAFAVNQLNASKQDVLHGLSGDLQIGKHGRIESAPMWIKVGISR